MKLGDVVRVIWVDAWTAHGWGEKPNLNVKTQLTTVICSGLFVGRTKTTLTISMGVSDLGQYLNTLEIPVESIKKVKLLEKSLIHGK